MTSLLDFYQQHGISPVRQDITDLEAHFRRRAALYRSLGLPPMAIRGASVLEVGPGGGENARYTLSLAPRNYEVVEPNAVAAEAMRAMIGWIDVAECRIEDYPSSPLKSPFDVVFCEGLLGLSGGDSPALLEACVRQVAPGGVLVITCIDAISDHAEVVRRAMAQRLIDRSAPLVDQVATLRPVFAPHLATLQGMTRSVDDWIVDNLLNPASIGPTFSIPDACAQLDGRFELLGCSPRFLMDWRWYKQQPPGLAWVIESYWQQCHNLYDYREGPSLRPRRENEPLLARCEAFRARVRVEESRPDVLLHAIVVDPAWFGRGQQYLSFVKL